MRTLLAVYQPLLIANQNIGRPRPLPQPPAAVTCQSANQAFVRMLDGIRAASGVEPTLHPSQCYLQPIRFVAAPPSGSRLFYCYCYYSINSRLWEVVFIARRTSWHVSHTQYFNHSRHSRHFLLRDNLCLKRVVRGPFGRKKFNCSFLFFFSRWTISC